MTTPEISIVIPAFNEAENLAELLGVLNAVASGLKPGSLESDGGTAASATSEYLPASALDQLIVGLCSQAGAIVSTVPISGTLIYENQTWGTRAAPELRCIDGLTDPGDSVTLNGNMNGSGILIVKNADLIVTGSLHWEGLIIVTGTEVSFKSTGAGTKEVFGGLIVNETGSPAGKALLDIQGSARLLFSRQSMVQAGQLITPAVLSSAYEHLPTTIRQDYWRTVTP